MTYLSLIADALSAPSPPPEPPGGRRRSAVAMLLREAAGQAELLLVERARHPGDPWSGDLGLPGGKHEPTDPDLQATAERETREEVGIELSSARLLGRLGDIAGAHLPVMVTCFVYQVTADVAVFLNPELQGAYWVPLDLLFAPARQTMATVRFRGERLLRPAVRLPLPGRDVLWGITYRLVLKLAERVPYLAAEPPPPPLPD